MYFKSAVASDRKSVSFAWALVSLYCLVTSNLAYLVDICVVFPCSLKAIGFCIIIPGYR